MENNQIYEEIIQKALTPVTVIDSFPLGRVTLNLMSNHAIMYQLDKEDIDWFYTKARVKDGRSIDSRTADIISYEITKTESTYCLWITYGENDLLLKQNFTVSEDDPYFKTKILLEDQRKETETNYLVPLDFIYPKSTCKELFLSLNQKMLFVPYDNDMWVNYESTYLKSDLVSYDVSCIFNEDTNQGLLIGALDFDVWKNAVACSGYDARVFQAICGYTSAATHDSMEHGVIAQKEVASSNFICGYFENIMDALEFYGQLSSNPNRLRWNHGTVFGWNSYSALTMYTTLDHFDTTSRFFQEELPNFCNEDSVAYINLDAVFGLDPIRLRNSIEEIHARGQKAGTYLAPLAHIPLLDELPLYSDPSMKRKDIILKMPDGENYHPIDGKYPIDITIPEAEMDLRLQLRKIVAAGFDYLKIDFLSHGAVEGIRHNKNLKTGRQALLYFYNILLEELDPEKIDREIFISSSIAPLYPCGFAHARRCSCDAFGHHEDVRYVLNALTFSYWASGNLYEFNDPDHTVLFRSLVDGRAISCENEAKSRYIASTISGTVMLLSDNYGPGENAEEIKACRERTQKLANSKEVNAVAAKHKAFRPIHLKDRCNVFYLLDKEENYLAVFNYTDQKEAVKVKAEAIKAPAYGKLINLYDISEISEYQKEICVELEAYSAELFQIKSIG